MEPVGLAIGAASLMTMLKTCLELYDTIECGRRHGRDYELLTTKIGIERVRLSLWGSHVGLPVSDFNEDGAPTLIDPRLQDPRILKAVSEVLSCMQQLFEDTSSMTRRYGLRSIQDDEKILMNSNQALMTTFQKTYSKFLDAAVKRQRATSFTKIARWAVKDKRRFENFVEDLRSFNDSLCALFPDIYQNVREEMVAEIKLATDLNGLQTVEKAISDMKKNSEMVEAASLRITELLHTTKSLADDDLDVETIASALEVEDSDSNTIPVAGVNMDRLVRQLDKLEAAISTNLQGVLQITVLHSFGATYSGWVTWEGIRDDEYNVQQDKEREYRKCPYAAWSMPNDNIYQDHQSILNANSFLRTHVCDGRYGEWPFILGRL